MLQDVLPMIVDSLVANRKAKTLQLYYQGEIQHNYHTFESKHDANQDVIVIFYMEQLTSSVNIYTIQMLYTPCTSGRGIPVPHKSMFGLAS